MMKNHQNNNQQVFDNKSVVGSMGSMGSLGPLMGIQDSSMTEGTEGYNTMKNMPNQEMNPNQTHFSQLQ